jgi:hypothetical protein
MRDAFGAIELSHPNLIRIDEIGEKRGAIFVSREAGGRATLAELTPARGKLAAEEATAYVLHAARGLKFAHDQGYIHGALTPDSIWIDSHGLVKVADVGLVNSPELAETVEAVRAGKRPAESARDQNEPQLTGPAPSTTEVPARASFIAPEVAAEPARIDGRADIYSLGRTLSFLITGRTPSDASSANDERALSDAAPQALTSIIATMTAKSPPDRFANLAATIDALEKFLGIAGGGSYTPGEDEVHQLEDCARGFAASPSELWRRRSLLSVVGLCLGIALLRALTGGPIAAGLLATLGFAMLFAEFVLLGFTRQTPVFSRVCELVSRARPSEWLTGAAAVAILAALLAVMKLLWVWMALCLLGIGLVVAVHAAFFRRIEAEREAPLHKAQEMIAGLRQRGYDEGAIRRFVCAFGGVSWQDLYEALFGYDSLREARRGSMPGSGTGLTVGFSAARDYVAAWLDGAIQARRDADFVETLQQFEERGLVSQGENLVSARRKSRRSALAMVATASEIRDSIRVGNNTFMVNHSIPSTMRDAALNPEKVLLNHERGLLPQKERGELWARLAAKLAGPKVRFLAGVILVAGCVAWMHQNAMISAEHAEALVEAAKKGDVTAVQSHAQAGIARARAVAAEATEPLNWPLLPHPLRVLVSSFGAGAGGLILIVSAIVGGARISLFALPAAAIPVLLPSLWHPALGGLDLNPSLVPSIVGAAILATGILIDRR